MPAVFVSVYFGQACSPLLVMGPMSGQCCFLFIGHHKQSHFLPDSIPIKEIKQIILKKNHIPVSLLCPKELHSTSHPRRSKHNDEYASNIRNAPKRCC